MTLLVVTLTDGTEAKLNDYKTASGLKTALLATAPQAILLAATDRQGAVCHVNVGHIVRVTEHPAWP